MNKRLIIIALAILIISIGCFFIFQKPTIDELYHPELSSDKEDNQTVEVIDDGEIKNESFSLFKGSENNLTPEQLEKQKTLVFEFENKLNDSLESIYAIEKAKENVNKSDLVNSIKEAIISDSFEITDNSTEDKVIVNINFITRMDTSTLTEEQFNEIFAGINDKLTQFSEKLYFVTNCSNEINFYINNEETFEAITYLRKQEG
jgi:hypothetical protein